MTLPIWMSMLSCGKYTKTEKKKKISTGDFNVDLKTS